MNYRVEYLVTAPAERTRAWLATLTGSWHAATAEELSHAELERGGVALHAWIAPQASLIRVPQIPYSWLVGKHPLSLEQVADLDAWLLESLPDATAVRLEEFLRLEWEERAGQTWDQYDDPVAAFTAWLPTTDADPEFYQFLTQP